MTDDMNEMREDLTDLCNKYYLKDLTSELSQRMISAGVCFLLKMTDRDKALRIIQHSIEQGIITHEIHTKWNDHE